MVNSRLCETARPLFQNSRPRPKHFISSEPERKTWGGGGGRGLSRQISSDRNDRKDFLGVEFFDFGSIFGRKSLVSIFWVA